MSINQRFTPDVKNWKATIEKEFVEGIRQIIIAIFDELVFRTPVDTGRARASWRIGIGSPDTSCEPLGKDGYPAIPSKEKNKLTGLSFDDLSKVIYITNSVEYIIPLEYGHSQQAPQGMVAVTAAEWKGRKLNGVTITVGA